MREDSSGDLSCWYRHSSKGGWPFSTADNGWPVSDCTAEGLKVWSDFQLFLLSHILISLLEGQYLMFLGQIYLIFLLKCRQH